MCTTFVVQGAQGAGKTALLHQLRGEAEGWVVVPIKPMVLETPAAMAQALGKAYTASERESLRASAQFVGVDLGRTLAGIQTVTEVLKRGVGPKEKVLLVMDEAQHLAAPSSDRAAAVIRDVLDNITNGETERHISLLLGGLSHTESALSDRGLSRLRMECCHTIGRFEKAATAASVIHDWLVEVGCDRQHIPAWTSALLPGADRWAQHIILCVASVRDHILAHGDNPSPSAIQSVLACVAERKRDFYSKRTRDVDGDAVAALGVMVGLCGWQEVYRHDELASVFDVPARSVDSPAIVQSMLAHGVLTKTDDGRYSVPIPSMERHLIGVAVGWMQGHPATINRMIREAVGIIREHRGVEIANAPRLLQQRLDSREGGVQSQPDRGGISGFAPDKGGIER